MVLHTDLSLRLKQALCKLKVILLDLLDLSLSYNDIETFWAKGLQG
jgi:hypothetical protein